MGTRRAWVVYSVGVFAYIISVTQRTTIGVAGVAATDRFRVDAATLSSLAVLQLVVYAAMQIPVGVLIDRYGPRRLMVTGTLLMLVGQVAVAFAPTIALAVAGRVLVGGGDAMLFTSVMRLTASWFHGHIVAQLSQWIGNLGQVGQVLSAIPFAFLLHETGWSVAFLSAAGCSLLAVVLVLAAIHDRPAGLPAITRPITLGRSVESLRAALARPGTQLGFWSHFSSQSAGSIFSLMWGYPFMVYALGYRPQDAAALLIVPVGAAVFAGPVVGILSARFPLRRSNLVLGCVALMGVAWAAVLAWPGQPPFGVILFMLIAIGIGGPGSVIGFDYARMFNPARSLGSANGVVNTGGFVASVAMIFLIGVILDAYNAAAGGGGPEHLYSMSAFRVAFLAQFLVGGIGVTFLLRVRQRTRRGLAEDEGIAVGPLWEAVVRSWRRRKLR
ncbi:MAG TPA: MFS transporter [Microbacteriaceae bacterium]|nr:MFS transporter [Microbacteriaceae bacterium]